MRPEIQEWLRLKKEEATKLYDEAEERRIMSGYSDMDALEQSMFNQGVLSTLETMSEFLKA